ncbi:MAG TPA: hypothetical protein VGC81_15325, partial [Candidatus Methylomirabilis sp.]
VLVPLLAGLAEAGAAASDHTNRQSRQERDKDAKKLLNVLRHWGCYPASVDYKVASPNCAVQVS